MKVALEHGRAFMQTSFLKSMLFMFMPEWVQFKFNLIPYPRETDNFFRNLSDSILKNAAEARVLNSKNVVFYPKIDF